MSEAPPPGIPANTSALLSIAFEWGLYGVSAVMFIVTLMTLFQKTPVNRTMVYISCTFFLVSTAHAILDLFRLYQGFILSTVAFGGSAGFFADVATQVFVAKSALYLITTLLGDGVVIYRAYSVWQRWWIIILPSALWCAVLVCGSVMLNILSNASRTGTIDVFVLGSWITSFFSASLAANFIATGLLALKIWQVNRQTTGYRTTENVLSRVMRVVIDSGILYSVTLLIALITYLRNSNAQYILVDMLVPIIPIAFYMIIIRLTKNETFVSTKGSANVSSGSYALRPVQVHISQDHDQHYKETTMPIDMSKAGRGISPGLGAVTRKEAWDA